MKRTEFAFLALVIALSILTGTALATTYEIVEGPPLENCGNSICSQEENCNNCPQDCGECTSQQTTENQSPSGSGSSGSETPNTESAKAEEEKPTIRGIEIDHNSENKTTTITVQIANGLNRSQAFSITATVKKDEKTEYTTTETTIFVGAKKTLKYKFKKQWKTEPGEYTLKIDLESKERKTKYDSTTKIIVIGEEGRIEIRDTPQTPIPADRTTTEKKSEEPKTTVTSAKPKATQEQKIDLVYTALWGIIAGILFISILIFAITKIQKK